MSYIVYWDCESQCELDRWTGPAGGAGMVAWVDSHEIFGGGNYNYYECPEGFKIVTVIGRDPKGLNKLKILLEEE